MTSKKEQKKIKINGKPKYINLGTDYNFFELFQKIQLNFVNCFLFESLGEESNISRYHIIGFDLILFLKMLFQENMQVD